MGLLSRLLNPKTALRGLVDPAGATISAVRGTKGSSSFIDPAGIFTSGIKPKPSVNMGQEQPTDPAAGVYGDSADPSFGSFTKPFDVEEFYKYQDPGYAFRLQQGRQAVLNGASAGSGALSGAAYKDLIDYNQNAASTEYGNAFNRYQTQQGNIFSRLSELAGLGQNAAANVGNQGTNLAGNAGQFLSNAGTAAGSGIVGAGNAISNGVTNAWLWNQLSKPSAATQTNAMGF